jgi:uncharacterized membrane protein YqjE
VIKVESQAMDRISDEQFEQLETVRLGTEGAAEMDQHRRIIFIPRADIIRIELVYGAGAERPAVLALLGLIFAALALVSAVTLVLLIIRGGVRMPAALITGVAFVIPAWWLTDLSIRKRWFLRVRGRSDVRKLVFHKTRSRDELEQFVEAARQRFGYM